MPIEPPDLYNEHALWKEVVLRPISEAIRPPEKCTTKQRLESHAAKIYIFHDPDFDLVASMANLDPEHLRKHVKRILQKRKKLLNI